jgi:hypothetical protein
MRRLTMLVSIGAALIAAVAQAQTTAPAPAQAPAKASAQAPAKEPSDKSTLTLSRTPPKPWTGDLDGMVKRRAIRVLVPYSKTFYFVDRAVQRGLSYDVTRLLEAELNKKLKTGNIRVHVICVPVSAAI